MRTNPTPAAVPPPPFALGSYLATEELGAGGCGAVYRGEAAATHRPVLIKIFAPKGPATSAHFGRALADFYHEAAVGKHLTGNAGFPAVRDVGFDPGTGRAYVVMDEVVGRTLRAYMVPGRLPAARAVGFVADLCGAVSRLHAAGVWHCDLKPENAVVEKDGRVSVIDFGLSVREDGSARAAGRPDGTPGYMAPEHARGRFAGPRSDQFSLGVVLAEALRPFPGLAPAGGAALAAHLHGLDPRLTDIARRATAARPARRYETVAEMESALRRWLHDQPLAVVGGLRTASPAGGRDGLCELPAAGSKAEAEGLLLRHVQALPAYDPTRAPRSGHDLSAAEHVAAEASRWGVRTVPAARFYARLARHHIGKNKLRLPGLWLARAADILAGETDKSLRLERAAWLDEFGCVQWTFGQSEKGLAAAREAYAVRRELLGPDDPLTNSSLNNVAEAYRFLGRTAEARSRHRESFEIERRRDERGNEFGWRCSNWGRMLALDGRAEEARAVVERGLRVKAKALDPDHLEVCFLLNNLAAILDLPALGEHQKAMLALERSLALRERGHGEESPYSLRVRNLLIESHLAHRELDHADRLSRLYADLPFAEDQPQLARGLELRLAVCRRRPRLREPVAEYLGRIEAIRACVGG